MSPVNAQSYELNPLDDSIDSLLESWSDYEGGTEFEDALLNRWYLPRKGALLSVLPPDDSVNSWRDLGLELTKRMITSGSWYGICVTGHISASVALHWVDAVSAEGRTNLLQLNGLSTLQGQKGLWDADSLTFTVLQPTYRVGWLPSFWESVSPRLFSEYGASLLFTVYETDMKLESAARDLSLSAFNETLDRAVAWLATYGDDRVEERRGFVAGLPRDSSLYHELTG